MQIVGFPMRRLKYVVNLNIHVVDINPYLTNGFSHHYQLDESTFIFRGVRSVYYFLSHFSMKFLAAIGHRQTEYCRSGNIRENLIFANIRELVASRIQSSR